MEKRQEFTLGSPAGQRRPELNVVAIVDMSKVQRQYGGCP